MVEYGPVQIGGINCTCPVKSASLTVQRSGTSGPKYKLNAEATKPGAPQTKMNQIQSSYDSAYDAPLVTKVSDARFSNYHQFRSDIRIVTGNNVAPVPDPPPSDVNRP
jgi:hypothetical protein